jgi:hypothetical protein
MAEVHYETPELLDRDVDHTHWSYVSVVSHTNLDPLRVGSGVTGWLRNDHWTDMYISR